MVVVGVAGIEENCLVPDNILKECAVGERLPAYVMPREIHQVEPVPGEPLRAVRKPAPVAFDMDQCGFLPEGSCRGEDRYGRGGVLEVVGQGGNIGSDLVPLVGIDDVAAAELK